MILSSVLLPDPLGPMTPILAPGKKESQMPRSTSRRGGTTLRRSFSVKTNWCAMGDGVALCRRRAGPAG